jgi:hypothetical protein
MSFINHILSLDGLESQRPRGLTKFM